MALRCWTKTGWHADTPSSQVIPSLCPDTWEEELMYVTLPRRPRISWVTHTSLSPASSRTLIAKGGTEQTWVRQVTTRISPSFPPNCYSLPGINFLVRLVPCLANRWGAHASASAVTGTHLKIYLSAPRDSASSLFGVGGILVLLRWSWRHGKARGDKYRLGGCQWCADKKVTLFVDSMLPTGKRGCVVDWLTTLI